MLAVAVSAKAESTNVYHHARSASTRLCLPCDRPCRRRRRCRGVRDDYGTGGGVSLATACRSGIRSRQLPDDIFTSLIAGNPLMIACMSEYNVEHPQGMHVVHDGPLQAPPLLLIHGSGASGASWSPMIPALAADHHVIRVDLPGCGQSPPARSYDVPVQARRVAGMLDFLGTRRVPVVAHSSGGYIATALAEQRRDLVRSIALISSGPRPDALLPQPVVLRALLAPPFGRLLWSVRSDAMIRNGITATAARPIAIPDEVVADLRCTTYRALRTVLQRNTAYITERSLPRRLAALDVPVLVIFGAADRRWEPSSAHLYDAIPNARVEMLPCVGHVPMFEAPETTSKLLLDFVAMGADPIP